jgi:hypothetical protein
MPPIMAKMMLHMPEQDEDETINIMPKKPSDLDEPGAARDLPVQGQQNDVHMVWGRSPLVTRRNHGHLAKASTMDQISQLLFSPWTEITLQLDD